MIGLHAIASTPPTTQPVDAPWVTAAIFGWLILSIVVAKSLGAFRAQFIVGPPRLGVDETIWSPVFAFFGGACAAVFITSLIAPFLPGQGEAKVLVQNGVVEALAVCGIIAFTILFRPNGLDLLGLRPIQLPRGIALGATTLLIIFPLIMIVGSLTEWIMNRTGRSIPTHEVLKSLRENHGRPFFILSIVFAVIGAPIAEEVAFRGFLQTVLAQCFHRLSQRPLSQNHSPHAPSRWIAVIVTSAIFAAVHKELAFFPPLFVLAIGLGYLYERSGNLWATISTHAFFNTIQILLFLGMT